MLGALICYPMGWLWQGTLVVTFFVLADMLDGLMAKLSGSASSWGAFLDSTLDRLGDGSRVVVTSSRGHYSGTWDWDDIGFERGGYSTLRAYNRSKLANVLHARHLAGLLEERGVTVVSFHPGAIGTDIWGQAPRYARPALSVAKLTPVD